MVHCSLTPWTVPVSPYWITTSLTPSLPAGVSRRAMLDPAAVFTLAQIVTRSAVTEPGSRKFALETENCCVNLYAFRPYFTATHLLVVDTEIWHSLFDAHVTLSLSPAPTALEQSPLAPTQTSPRPQSSWVEAHEVVKPLTDLIRMENSSNRAAAVPRRMGCCSFALSAAAILEKLW